MLYGEHDMSMAPSTAPSHELVDCRFFCAYAMDDEEFVFAFLIIRPKMVPSMFPVTEAVRPPGDPIRRPAQARS